MLTMKDIFGLLDTPDKVELMRLMATELFHSYEKESLLKIADAQYARYIHIFPVPSQEVFEMMENGESEISCIKVYRKQEKMWSREISLSDCRRVIQYYRSMGNWREYV